MNYLKVLFLLCIFFLGHSSLFAEGVGEYRIVLNWGNQPRDLDAHLVYTGNHVFFEQREGEGVSLLGDDTSGSGPETMTIWERKNGELYVYAVHDFVNQGKMDSQGLSLASAKISLYQGDQLKQTYFMTPNIKANLWIPFAIDEEGEIKEIHQFSFARNFNEVKKILEARKWKYRSGVKDYTQRSIISGVILYSIVDHARVRDAPNLKSKTLGFLSIKEEVRYMGEQSKLTLEVSLRGQKYKSPFLKVQRGDGTVGWVYGGGLKVR